MTGVIYVTLDDTHAEVMRKIMDMHTRRLFGVDEVPGTPSEVMFLCRLGEEKGGDIKVRGDEETKRCLLLMKQRGWKDRLVVECV